METNVDISAREPSQWGMIFVLFSLDAVQPLWREMGVNMLEPEEFQEKLRALIIENRKIYEEDPTVIPPLADKVLGQIERDYGAESVERFFIWATTVFYETHEDLPQWSAWDIIFRQWAYNSQYRQSLQIPEARRDEIFDEYRARLDTSGIRQTVAQIKTASLSNWDLEMFSIHQFVYDDIGDPFVIVLQIVEMNRFQLYWEKMLRATTSDERARMWEAGRQILKSLRVWMPGELVPPDRLRRKL